MIISYNIGYSNPAVGSGILTYFSLCREVKTFKEFSDMVRMDAREFFNLAKDRYIIPSSMCLFLSVYEFDGPDPDCFYEAFYCINLKNVREYKALLDYYIKNNHTLPPENANPAP